MIGLKEMNMTKRNAFQRGGQIQTHSQNSIFYDPTFHLILPFVQTFSNFTQRLNQPN